MKRLAYALGALAVGMTVVAGIFAAIVGNFAEVAGCVLLLAFPIVGLVIVRAQPRSVVAWCFLISPLLLGIEECGQTMTTEGLRRHWPSTVTHTAAWAQSWAWFPGLFLLITVALLRFPDSRLIGPRWRWVERVAIAAMTVWSVGLGIVATQLTPQELNSSNAPDPHGPYHWFFLVAESMFFVVFACVLASFASLIIRFRRGGAVERAQIKWVLFAATSAILLEIVLDVGGTSLGPWPDWVQTIGESVSFGLIAIATGVAITRHGLFEIDRVVSRTVSYVLVTGLLLGAYIGLIAGLSALLPTNVNSLVVAAATLLVAAAFVPVRRAVQARVDRRFNRRRMNRAALVERFADQLRRDVAHGQDGAALLTVVQRALEPTHAGLWLVKQ